MLSVLIMRWIFSDVTQKVFELRKLSIMWVSDIDSDMTRKVTCHTDLMFISFLNGFCLLLNDFYIRLINNLLKQY